MKLKGTKSTKSGEGREPEIRDLRKSMRRLRILTASLFALTIVLNLTPAAAEIKAKITGEDVVDGSLTGADIQDRGLSGVDVAGGSIDGFNIALDTLVGGHVVDDSLSSLDVQDDSLTGADVQNNSLTGVDVASSSLNGSHVVNDSLTGADIDESTLANLDAHTFSPSVSVCDPHSETFIECGTLSFTLGHAMPVIAFWNYGFGSEIEGDRADGVCQPRIDDLAIDEVRNVTYEDQPDEATFGLGYGATPSVWVGSLSIGTHTVSLWCREHDPDDNDFVVFDLKMAVVELGFD